MKYLIFLDIDGTIVSDGKIHNRTIDGIREAQKRGHMVFINTGRSMDVIQKNVLEAVKPSGIVAGLGAYISVENEVLFSVCATRELAHSAAYARSLSYFPGTPSALPSALPYEHNNS